LTSERLEAASTRPICERTVRACATTDQSGSKAGTPDDIAHAAVDLASDEAAFVHGTVLDIDGGRVGVAVIAPAQPRPAPPSSSKAPNC
jgi:NAD(P)-dependent dehydrogenase (short-subunit alcohol dehydrogenase family)